MFNEYSFITHLRKKQAAGMRNPIQFKRFDLIVKSLKNQKIINISYNIVCIIKNYNLKITLQMLV